MTAPEPTLPPERVEELAEALRTSRLQWGVHADRWGDVEWQREFWTEAANIAAPLVAGWLAEQKSDLLDRTARAINDVAVDQREQGAAEVRARVEAAIRLVSPDHITPMGARQILAALATEREEKP